MTHISQMYTYLRSSLPRTHRKDSRPSAFEFHVESKMATDSNYNQRRPLWCPRHMCRISFRRCRGARLKLTVFTVERHRLESVPIKSPTRSCHALTEQQLQQQLHPKPSSENRVGIGSQAKLWGSFHPRGKAAQPPPPKRPGHG